MEEINSIKKNDQRQNIKIPLRQKFDYCVLCIYGNLPECKNLFLNDEDDKNYCLRYEKPLEKTRGTK